MATTYTLIKLCIRMQGMSRLPIPHIVSSGMIYPTTTSERNRYFYRSYLSRNTTYPELIGANSLLIKKGSIGGYNSWRNYSTSTSKEDVKKAEKERLAKKKPKKWTAETIKIMLVSETGALSSVTLEDAKSIAKKQRLELVHIVDDKEKPVRTDKEVYKLVSKLSSMNSFDDESQADVDPSSSSKESKQKNKDEKTVILKSNVGDHDLNSKINQMLKWTKKGHRIKVMIGQAGTTGNAETVFKTIEERMKEGEGQIQQKIIKGAEIRFYVGPPKAKKLEKVKSSTQDDIDLPDSSDTGNPLKRTTS